MIATDSVAVGLGVALVIVLTALLWLLVWFGRRIK